MAANLKIKAILEGIDNFTSPMRRVIAGIRQGLGRALSGVTGLAKAAGGAIRGMLSPLTLLAGGAGLAGLTALVDGVAAAGDEVGKTARRVGLSVEALQELRHAASMSGIGATEFNDSLKKLSVGLGQLKMRQGPLVALLKQTSPEFQKQFKAARNNEEAFDLLVKAMRRIEDPAKRAAFATAAFGESGVKLVHLAEGGETALADMRAEARRLGLVMSEDATKNAEAYGDSMTRLKGSLGSLKVAIGTGLIPILQPLVERLTGLVVANREIIGTKIASFFSTVGNVIKSIDWSLIYEGIALIGTSIKSAWNIFQDFKKWFSGLKDVLGEDVVSALGMVGKAVVALGTTFMISPVGAAVAAIGLAAGLIIKHWAPISGWFRALWDTVSGAFSKFWNYLDNKFGAGIRKFVDGFRKVWDTLSGFFTGLWELVKEPFLSFATFIGENFIGGMMGFIESLKSGWDTFKVFIGALWDVVGTIFSTAKDVIVGILDFIMPDALKDEWEGVKDFFSDLWGGITDIFEGAWEIIKGIIEAVQDGVDAVMDAANKLNPFSDGPSQAEITKFQRRMSAGELNQDEQRALDYVRNGFQFGAPVLPASAPSPVPAKAQVDGAITIDFKNMPQGVQVDKPKQSGPVSISANVGRRRLGMGMP